MSRERTLSFSEIDHAQASGILADILRESNVFLGGSSVGKGLKKAARYYLHQQESEAQRSYFELANRHDLALDVTSAPVEDPFYIVDIGIVVSQVYQWRRFFPRVEPFYAVKCNPDPVIIKTLGLLGCNFDCASRAEIRLVQELTKDLPRTPEIIYANPCKARAHLLEAVCRGVNLVTFDNATEVAKIASISKHIRLILRIITDDRGSQCRLSSKFGAPRMKWRPLLSAARRHGLQVVGVSFHVGSGCRDASRYADALKDVREIFDLAEKEFGMNMSIVDIGGGFPGETHSLWNPATELDPEDQDEVEGKLDEVVNGQKVEEEDRYMTFTEVAEQVAPVLDRLFPAESGVRIIGEPGRYLVAACATLCCSVVSARSNELDTTYAPEAVDDQEAAMHLHEMTREEEDILVRKRGTSLAQIDADNVMATIQEELEDYSRLFAAKQLAQQEFDVYNDPLDLYNEGFASAADLLGPPEEGQKRRQIHTVEGMTCPLVSNEEGDGEMMGLLTLGAAGEAAVNGVVMQAVADSAPLQDDYSYYINDGVYGAFNVSHDSTRSHSLEYTPLNHVLLQNIMFDHASVRPRILRVSKFPKVVEKQHNGLTHIMEAGESSSDDEKPRDLFASTVFGPTCDSIDVIARSVLLPKLTVGDWMYFQNMGAYTMAAASSFNGFQPSGRFYVCSVMPEYFEALIRGPEEEEKKEEN